MSLKKAYLYLVSIISLIIMVVDALMLINMALKTWVFKKADQNYYSYACPASVAPDGKLATCDPAAQEQQKKQDEENRAAQKQRDAAQAIAMLLVATPVWYFHWRLAKREV